MSPLIGTVRRTIARHGMLAPGDRVIAGVSGGPDSIAMLHVLAELAAETGITLAAVAHLDHGFRPDSGEDASFVERAASRLGIESVVEKSDLPARLAANPANRQAAARDARYDLFERTAVRFGARKVAVGHTADDQAETYLMRELRGSGVQGLSGIPPVRGRIIRPLIDAGRGEVEAYLEEKGIPFRTDPTNLKPGYLRNRLRLEVMPLLKKYNPRVVAAMCHAAGILREEDGFLAAYAEDVFHRILAKGPDGVLALDLVAFVGLHAAIKRRVLRLAIGEVKGDTLGVGYVHVMEAAESVAGGGTGRGIDIPGGVRVERSCGMLLVYLSGSMRKDYSTVLPVPGRAEVREAGISVEAGIIEGYAPGLPHGGRDGVFDLERMSGTLEVRNRRPGDFFYPAGMAGRKKLGDYFIDLKLPRIERARAPILTCGGEVAWVMGRRVDRRFAADEKTKRAVLISYKHI